MHVPTQRQEGSYMYMSYIWKYLAWKEVSGPGKLPGGFFFFFSPVNYSNYLSCIKIVPYICMALCATQISCIHCWKEPTMKSWQTCTMWGTGASSGVTGGSDPLPGVGDFRGWKGLSWDRGQCEPSWRAHIATSEVRACAQPWEWREGLGRECLPCREPWLPLARGSERALCLQCRRRWAQQQLKGRAPREKAAVCKVKDERALAKPDRKADKPDGGHLSQEPEKKVFSVTETGTLLIHC